MNNSILLSNTLVHYIYETQINNPQFKTPLCVLMELFLSNHESSKCFRNDLIIKEGYFYKSLGVDHFNRILILKEYCALSDIRINDDYPVKLIEYLTFKIIPLNHYLHHYIKLADNTTYLTEESILEMCKESIEYINGLNYDGIYTLDLILKEGILQYENLLLCEFIINVLLKHYHEIGLKDDGEYFDKSRFEKYSETLKYKLHPYKHLEEIDNLENPIDYCKMFLKILSFCENFEDLIMTYDGCRNKDEITKTYDNLIDFFSSDVLDSYFSIYGAKKMYMYGGIEKYTGYSLLERLIDSCTSLLNNNYHNVKYETLCDLVTGNYEKYGEYFQDWKPSSLGC